MGAKEASGGGVDGRGGRMEKDREEKAYQWACVLCRCAGENEDFLQDFWRRLVRSEGVYREFVHYLENRDFLCGYKVQGYDVVDIMVWQLDHFKAQLDRGRNDGKDNGDRMLLLAFDTMLKMERDPQYYVNLMQTETGTDYEGKYQ